MGQSTQVLISGNKLKLTTGSYQLVWGSLNPQELNNSAIVIACDLTDGGLNVILPPTSQQQSNFATIVVGKVDSAKNNVTVYPSDGDTIDGQSDTILGGQFDFRFAQNLYGANWTVLANVVK